MRTWMLAAGVAFAAVLAAYWAGRRTSEEHVVSVEAEYPVSPESVYAVLIDASRFTEWRSGLSKVEVEGEVITEHSSFGPFRYRFAEQIPARRLVTADAGGREKGFTGAWTFELEPANGGTRLRITERGRIFSPWFRLMARYVFGYETSLRQYHADLAKRLR